MGYAIKCYFSEASAEPIYKIWNSLANSGLSDFMIKSGSLPGITLGLWDDSREEPLIHLLRQFAEHIPPLKNVCTYGLATFPTNPAHVFLGIVPTKALLDFQQFLHSIDKQRCNEGSIFYKPGNWVPHSTLAIRCKPDDVSPIINVCMKHDTRLELEIASVGLLETGTARRIETISYKQGNGA